MADHAPLQPSSMEVTAHCPGSVSLMAQFPQLDTEETLEGDAVHLMGRNMLHNAKRANGDYRPTLEGWLGVPVGNHGIVVTREMYEAAEMYFNYVAEVVGDNWADLHIEERVNCSIVHAQCWGTPDAWIIINGVLYVIDLKYGHLSVSARSNWQLMSYTLGILTGESALQVDLPIVNTIIQPRDYTGGGQIKECNYSSMDLRGPLNQLRHQCEIAMRPNAPLSVGNHCYFCSARTQCPANKAVAAHHVDFALTTGDLTIPNNAAMGYELSILTRAVKQLEDRKKALEATIEAQIKTQGTRVPGWAMQSVSGRAKWTNEAGVLDMADMFGIDLTRRTEVCTPAEAKRRLKSANIDESVIVAYYKHPTALKLLPTDDEMSLKFGDNHVN